MLRFPSNRNIGITSFNPEQNVLLALEVFLPHPLLIATHVMEYV